MSMRRSHEVTQYLAPTRVIASDDANPHPADLKLVPVVHHLNLPPSSSNGLGAPLIADDADPRVAVQEPPKPLRVEMIGVLVGEQHRGQPLQRLEPAREGARVQQHPGLRLLHQQARVPELGQPHPASLWPAVRLVRPTTPATAPAQRASGTTAPGSSPPARQYHSRC